MANDDFIFGGWVTPNFTMIPDQFFDEVMPYLSEAELRVLLYIMRRTFGFKKQEDAISLKQMVVGISTRDGEILDRGCGLSKAAVAKGLKLLSEKGIICAIRNQSRERGNLPTTYGLRFASTSPLSTRETRGCLPNRQGLVHEIDTQETVEQETERQEGFEISKDSPPVDNSVDNTGDASARNGAVQTPAVATLIIDFSREMGDTKHLASNISQAERLLAESGMGVDDFFALLYEARLRTRKAAGLGNRMAYFFAVLRDLVAGPGADVPAGAS